MTRYFQIDQLKKSSLASPGPFRSSNSFSNTSHLAEAAFAENLDEVKVLEAPPWDLSVLPDGRGRGRGGRRGGGGGRIGGGVLGSLLVE